MTPTDHDALREGLARAAYVQICREHSIEGWREAGVDWDQREEWGNVYSAYADLALAIADEALASPPFAPLLAKAESAERLAAEIAALRAAQDEALRKAVRAWSKKLHIPVTRMMSRALREEFAAALRTDPPAGTDAPVQEDQPR
ncbi:MAG: hypothetical protein WAP03_21640 [Methylorubrum rhodinum]|uniref:hypothetical protein n=1 Tax=Methylorubrum rhodinum TaxID=29428 RepID=UPI003BAFD940